VAATEPISGVVIRVPLPATLEGVRRQHDIAAASGAPAHVTILFPFLPVTQLAPSVRQELVRIAGTVLPFEVRFARVGRFPGVVYLVPQPAAPFRRLTEALAERFPAYPPYGGTYDEVVPHLTLTESDSAPLDAIADAARRSLPFTHCARAIELLTEDGSHRWRRHWRIPLGIRP
jgi:2'-5' RNA ligase